ncbi:endo-1,6-alpha-mannosidase [Fistulina hepatica ATCC 64428]|nr:endo-1,6-alpha-mannosidase [Fistulina hepatica ATCC 64428]
MLLFASIALIFSCVFGQNLSVPPDWREPSTNRTYDERVQIAQDAINAIIPQLDAETASFNGIGYWQSGNVFSAMAIQDQIVGTSTNQDLVVDGLNTAWSLYTDYDQYGTMMMPCGGPWGPSMRTRRTMILAYFSPTFVILLFLNVYTSVITEAVASSGQMSGKDFTVNGTCDGVSMVGGVFWQPTSDGTAVNSITTGLSAALAEATGNDTYIAAAVQSATWIRDCNMNEDYIVLDTVDGETCIRSSATELFTYNSGKYIEGLSYLKDMTEDDTWEWLMVNITAAAVNCSAWEGDNGVITEGASPDSNNDGVGFKAIFIRGFGSAFRRTSCYAKYENLIHSYIDVQYNALLELAANGSTYSSSWLGPPQAFTTWGQLASLDVLTAAIFANSP